MKICVPLLIVLSLLAVSLPASAAVEIAPSAERVSGEPPRAYVTQGARVSLDQAVSMVRQRYGGKVVNAKTRKSGNRRVHEIRLLFDDGRVKTVRVDAETGKIF